MTFELDFTYRDTLFEASVTQQGKDFLVNLVSPAYYETAPTIAFTVHDDKSMKYDNSLFEDKEFMPVIEAAIRKHIDHHSIQLNDVP